MVVLIFERKIRVPTILPIVGQSFDSYCDLLSESLLIFVHLIVVPRESDHKGLGEWCSNFAIVTIKAINIACHGELTKVCSSNMIIAVIMVYSEFYIDT